MSGSPTLFDSGGGSGGSSNPLTTTGDMIYSSPGSTQVRLPIGTANQAITVLGSNTTPSWNSINQSIYKNYINVNPDAEVDITGWNTYANGTPANTPTNGFGGTPTGLTLSRSTSSPLRGAASFSIVQANSTSIQGKGVAYPFSIDSADQAKQLSIYFDYNASSTFIASNGITPPLNDGTTATNAGNSDIEVFMYDVVNSVLIPVSPQVITGNGSNNYSFYGTFQTASNSTSYRLIYHVATTSANATGWTFKFDNVYVGRQQTVQGSVASDWNNQYIFTPSAGFGTTTGLNIYSRRVGDSLQVRGYWTNGTVAASTALITMPPGISIDTTKMGSAGAVLLGQWLNIPSGATQNLYSAQGNAGPLFYDGSTTNQIFFSRAAASGTYTKINGNVDFSSSGVPSFDFTVPISGWSSNVQMSNATDTRVVSFFANANSGTQGAGFANVTTWTVVKDTHGAFSSGTTYTIPVSGFYSIYTQVTGNVSTTTEAVQIMKNGVAQSTNFIFGGSNIFPNASTRVTLSCVAGDTIQIQSNDSGGNVIKTNSLYNIFTVDRISGPEAIAAAETVSMRYFSSSSGVSGSLGTVTYTTKDFDDHNLYSSGVYTIPISGKYQINAGLLITGTVALNNNLILEIQKNNTVVSRFTEFFAATLTDGKAVLNDCINCLAGDTIRIQASSSVTGPSIVSSNFDNFLSLVRVGN